MRGISVEMWRMQETMVGDLGNRDGNTGNQVRNAEESS